MKKLFSSENIEAWALALPVIFAAVWWIFGVSTIASEAKAKVDSQAILLQETHDAVLIIKKDIEYLKESRGVK